MKSLARTFVELADTLVNDFDVVDFLSTLARRCSEFVDPSDAGIMLVRSEGGLRVVASSSDRARLLEICEIQNQQGPCLDCFNTGEAVGAEDLESDGRWPVFAPEAIRAGYRSAHALPLGGHDQVIGALNLFGSTPGCFNPGDLIGAQAMADIATIGILQQRAVLEARVLAEQLQSALNSRVVIEQAKGVLAERTQIDLDEAFKLLRDHARNNRLRLREVAVGIIEGTITLVPHSLHEYN
ncbi:MAG: GAF and ANTAR domain-containing protein [Actinomycetota bacterium]